MTSQNRIHSNNNLMSNLMCAFFMSAVLWSSSTKNRSVVKTPALASETRALLAV